MTVSHIFKIDIEHETPVTVPAQIRIIGRQVLGPFITWGKDLI